MHPALETFLKEYQIWLKATEDKCDTTQQAFDEIKQEVSKNGITEELLKELFHLSHSLFQTNYLLMESHMRVNNIRANYSKEEQEIIDDYNEIAAEASRLIRAISAYEASCKKVDEERLEV